ncbi:MAG: hypothetical protein CVV05_13170 [Gammaproteobacteria bacterium HGW-Gammaproteobacteria-1]|nr:MAG: hypothetical protein CVV05_13170 [Gammaproteobacteria bacterium HGW-Gammaproteobacteria-1]
MRIDQIITALVKPVYLVTLCIRKSNYALEATNINPITITPNNTIKDNILNNPLYGGAHTIVCFEHFSRIFFIRILWPGLG